MARSCMSLIERQVLLLWASSAGIHAGLLWGCLGQTNGTAAEKPGVLQCLYGQAALALLQETCIVGFCSGLA
jgi:hypothetical protein